MRIREIVLSVTIAVLLTSCLVFWPRAAAAAGQSDRGSKDALRIDWAAAFQTERTESRYSPLALRLFGGFSQVEAGDINNGLDGNYEWLKFYSAYGWGTVTGSYNPLHNGYHAGADLIFQINRNVGIGIGTGYMRFSKSSLATWSFGTEDAKLSGTPTLSAVPIRLGLFLTVPLANWINLTINGGVAAFAALKLDSRQRFDYSDGDWTEMSLSASKKAAIDNLGFEGSLGLEFMISRNTGFFVEVLGRYARLKNFDKATMSDRYQWGDVETIEGRLYLEIYRYAQGDLSTFTVEETPPVSDPPYAVFTEPKIDLSGFSLQAGLRIRL